MGLISTILVILGIVILVFTIVSYPMDSLTFAKDYVMSTYKVSKWSFDKGSKVVMAIDNRYFKEGEKNVTTSKVD